MESTLNKKKFTLPTAYTVLLIITALIALATQFIPGVQAAKLSDLVMAPINGLNEAIDIAIFVLLIGGFLGVTTYTGALPKRGGVENSWRIMQFIQRKSVL